MRITAHNRVFARVITLHGGGVVVCASPWVWKWATACLFVDVIVYLQGGAEVENRDQGCVWCYLLPFTPCCCWSYHHRGPFGLDKSKRPSMQKLDFPPVSKVRMSCCWDLCLHTARLSFFYTRFCFILSVWLDPFLRSFIHNWSKK